MNHAPPTSPVALPTARPFRAKMVLFGMAIHAACVSMTCFVVPLAMGSNIWPIAGIFWSVMTVPVALLTGAFTGWLSRKLPTSIAIPLLVVTGIALAIAAGIVMANNQ